MNLWSESPWNAVVWAFKSTRLPPWDFWPVWNILVNWFHSPWFRSSIVASIKWLHCAPTPLPPQTPPFMMGCHCIAVSPSPPQFSSLAFNFATLREWCVLPMRRMERHLPEFCKRVITLNEVYPILPKIVNPEVSFAVIMHSIFFFRLPLIEIPDIFGQLERT